MLDFDYRDILASLGIDSDLLSRFRRLYRSLIFSRKKQLEFIEDFQSWLEDGGNVRKACDAIIESAEEVGDDNKPPTQVARTIREAVTNGFSMSDGMEEWFDNEVIMIFNVGEQSGELKEVIRQYMDNEESIKTARSQLIKALLYPSIALAATTIMAMIFAGSVFPKFAGLIDFKNWPAVTQTFTLIYGFLSNNLLTIIFIGFALVIWYRWFLVNGNGIVRRLLQNIFPFSIFTYLQAMKVTKTMGLLVGRVYNPRNAALKMSKTAKPFLRWHLKEIARREEQGSLSLADSFSTGLIPKRLLIRMKATSAIGGTESKLKALVKAGERSGEEGLKALSSTQKTLSNMLFLLSIGTILFLVASFFELLSEIMTMV